MATMDETMVGEEGNHLRTFELCPCDLPGLWVNGVQLENPLRNVQPDHSLHGNLLSWEERLICVKNSGASMPSSVNLLFFMSVILLVDGPR